MIVYTHSEARQKSASLLEQAVKEGEDRIQRKDRQTFAVRPEPSVGSRLDVKGVHLGITTAEIVQFIHEGRRTVYESEAALAGETQAPDKETP